MVLVDCPHVADAYVEIEAARDETVEVVTIVETELVLDANEPGYDRTKFYELIEAIHGYMKANETVNRVCITRKQTALKKTSRMT
jgi:hypothetical protein